MGTELRLRGEGGALAGGEEGFEGIPPLIGRLERLASLPGGEKHPPVLRLWRQTFNAWLDLSVAQRMKDLNAYFHDSRCDPRLGLSEECYCILVPQSATAAEKHLFWCALRVALASLRNESARGLARLRVVTMLDLAQQHHGTLPLEEIARLLGQSRRHLGQLFARRTGVTFRRYSLWLRILKAVELLRHPSHAVKSIAGVLGYADPSNFVREFRCVLRTTPGAFREQSQ